MEHVCQYCLLIFKNSSNLKAHLTSSKKCLKLRGIKIESKYNCSGCNSIFMTKINLSVHKESCKNYSFLQYKEEYEKKIEIIKEEYEDKFKKLKEEYEYKFKKLKEEINILNSTISSLSKNLEKNKFEYDNYLILKIQHDLLEKQHEKTIAKLEMKISQCDSFIQKLALEGVSKPTTTTNNTVNNTIRNQLSSTYTLDKLEPKNLEDTMREHYTEHDFFGGQKRLANFFFERVIKTPDDKMLICCTDTSRRKFKILDLRGNMKEDIEARLLCDKLKVPTQMITKEIYDKVIDRIDMERERLSSDDRSRREKLLDDTMKAQQVFIDNMNFDDLNYNQDFMHELCVILNV